MDAVFDDVIDRNPDSRVAVLEAGPEDARPEVHMLAAFPALFKSGPGDPVTAPNRISSLAPAYYLGRPAWLWHEALQARRKVSVA